MSSNFGKCLEISIFGESHGPLVGVCIDGLTAGCDIDMEYINKQMARRAPGNDPGATQRKEPDIPVIKTGSYRGKTTGAPLMAVIENTNTRSVDYENIELVPRPSHSDYPAYVKYGGHNDIRGGGHFSGRLTACMVFAGALCRSILRDYDITIGGHVYSIGNAYDDKFDMCEVDKDLLNRLSSEYFAVINEDIKVDMQDIIMLAKKDCNSVGGIIEVAVCGIPAGVGFPMFRGVENVISQAVFAVPAVKGIEFGAGFDFSCMTGVSGNDQYKMSCNTVKTMTNNNGGILGGITTGMPIVFRAAVKPTSSIATEQRSVNLATMQNTKLVVKGRHDPCIVPRALPVIESAAAIAVFDLLLENGTIKRC